MRTIYGIFFGLVFSGSLAAQTPPVPPPPVGPELPAVLAPPATAKSSAFFEDPHLTVGETHFCLWDPAGVFFENDLGCWDFHGKALPTPRDLRNPKQVTAGNGYTCALEGNPGTATVRCWGEAGKERTEFFKTLTKVREVAAGPTDTCAVDEDQGVRCYAKTSLVGSDLPTERKLHQVVVGRTHACGIGPKGAVCWGGNRSTRQQSFEERMQIFAANLQFTTPRKDLDGVIPAEIAIGQGRFTCDLDRNMVALLALAQRE